MLNVNEPIRVYDTIVNTTILDSDVGSWVGFIITTTLHDIRVIVSNEQDCCESWGFLSTEDNISSLVGRVLKTVTITTDDDGYERHMLFATLQTDQDTFQLTVYNEHNGYYGHSAHVSIDGERFSTTL